MKTTPPISKKNGKQFDTNEFLKFFLSKCKGAQTNALQQTAKDFYPAHEPSSVGMMSRRMWGKNIGMLGGGLLGLGLAATNTFYEDAKTNPSEQKKELNQAIKTGLAIAGAGAILSVIGLLQTIRSVRAMKAHYTKESDEAMKNAVEKLLADTDTIIEQCAQIGGNKNYGKGTGGAVR